jgi:cell division transport system ATP-binding protein
MHGTKRREMIIRMFRISKRYGKKDALVDVTLDIYENDFLFVTGPSGAGKSTMMKLLYMGETLTEGSIIIDGLNFARITRKQVPQIRRRLGIIFQDFKLIPTRTVFRNVALVLEVAGAKPREIQEHVSDALKRVGMSDRADEFPPVLSGGEQQRVAVARAIVGNPKIILADEPTGSLDPDSAKHIFGLLQAAHTLGATVIIATHDREMIERHTGKIIRLENGRMVGETQNSELGIEN